MLYAPNRELSGRLLRDSFLHMLTPVTFISCTMRNNSDFHASLVDCLTRVKRKRNKHKNRLIIIVKPTWVNWCPQYHVLPTVWPILDNFRKKSVQCRTGFHRAKANAQTVQKSKLALLQTTQHSCYPISYHLGFHPCKHHLQEVRCWHRTSTINTMSRCHCCRVPPHTHTYTHT